MREYPGALFFSSGGYHHHIGVNVWAGINAPPPSREHVQLRSFSIILPNLDLLDNLTVKLKEKGIKVMEGLINPIKGYVGITVQDFDGNNVEIVTTSKVK
ncbi:Catechol-2,3-dioxygenase [archaeon HR06]|nr:Catechol-2,3-dioxygenase [archaeon HR06]